MVFVVVVAVEGYFLYHKKIDHEMYACVLASHRQLKGNVRE